MADDVVIRVENVSKKYCKSLKRSMLYGVEDIGRNLVGLSSRSDRLRGEEFWAVDDVSFELRKGDTLGLVGVNGSGKSSLLKMLNGIFWPDKGKITIKGRVGALIEVGAGFHPLLSGRENVYINGAILGMSKQEVDERFDDIVRFADIGDFIDVPVRSYSSGMFVRLGFAVAIHCDPDILLIDEALAVGDSNFQNRCIRHITQKMSHCTVILVSHAPNLIRFNCKTVLFIDKGQTKFFGPSSEGIDEYSNFLAKQSNLANNSAIEVSKYDPRIELTQIDVLDKDYNKVEEVFAGEKLIIECTFNVIKPLSNAIFGVQFWLDNFEQSFSCYSSQGENGKQHNLESGEHRFQLTIPNLSLKAGMYSLGLRICEKNVLAEHAVNIGKFLLVKNPRPEFGLYNLKFRFDLDREMKVLETQESPQNGKNEHIRSTSTD
jgi:lipopolysaccharide transport system ATP-binding protein